MLSAAAVSCDDDNDGPMSRMDLEGVSSELITSRMDGDTIIWSWPRLADGLAMEVDIRKDGQPYATKTVTSGWCKLGDVETNVPYNYIFRITDGTRHSDAIVKTLTRGGASSLRAITARQTEGEAGYEAVVTWEADLDASAFDVYATDGTRVIEETVEAGMNSYTVSDVEMDSQWNFTVRAVNNEGKSLPATASVKIGKTAVAFLSAYATPEELIEKGDDDEASAWLWFHAEYPNSRYLYAGDIQSADDLEPYRVLFYIRDVDNGNENTVWNQPAIIKQATPFIQEWYREGGNLLLWQHAVTYITDLGRMDRNLLQSNDRRITTGVGSYNTYMWYMAVQINPASHFCVDFSKHPLYNGVDVLASGRTKLITVKSTCWTEDHNCCFFNIPRKLTGIGDQNIECYNKLTTEYGIYPLAVWDSQIDWVSQLNVWEARQGNTEYKGTVLCMGNGGLEFSYKNNDGTPDISAYPRNNAYQSTILRMASNAIEYLKTR